MFQFMKNESRYPIIQIRIESLIKQKMPKICTKTFVIYSSFVDKYSASKFANYKAFCNVKSIT